MVEGYIKVSKIPDSCIDCKYANSCDCASISDVRPDECMIKTISRRKKFSDTDESPFMAGSVYGFNECLENHFKGEHDNG